MVPPPAPRVTPRLGEMAKLASVSRVPPFRVSWPGTKLPGVVPRRASLLMRRTPPETVVLPA